MARPHGLRLRSPITAGLLAVLVASCTAGSGGKEPAAGGGTSPSADLRPPLEEVADVGERLGFPAETGSWSVAAGDLSGSGRANDLVISYHSSIRVYRFEDGRYQQVHRPRLGDPHACAIGDVDLDRLGDIYCSRGGGAWKEEGFRKTNGLWIQGPAGTFSENVAPRYGVRDPRGRGRQVTFFDLDGDEYPDLFVGNQSQRADGAPSPNRTFVNEGGRGFREVRVGLTSEIGTFCVQAVDVDGDGLVDLLVCGADRLFLYRSEEEPDGTRRFRDVAPDLGLDLPAVVGAVAADFDGDGRIDVAALQRTRLRLLLAEDGGFREQTVGPELESAVWLATGDVDGWDGPDLYVVTGCDRDERNREDVLLLNDGAGAFEPVPTPQAGAGCGDTATAVDVDGDGRDEMIVLNGRPVGMNGPVQVLTLSPALAG